MITITLYDDNEKRRDSLQMLLEMEPKFKLLACYANALDVVEQTLRLNPDVVLMDIQMPGINGIEAVKLIKNNAPDTKIIMQTVFEDDDKIFDSLRFGASGYILKKTESTKIIEAIKEVMEGGSPMTPTIATKVLHFFRDKNESKNEEFGLTDRELKALNYLVRGMSYRQIAEEMNISYFTVNSHIKKIYQKLHVHSLAEAINKAMANQII